MSGVAVASSNAANKDHMLAQALSLLQSAIELLDRAEAPGQIAAHIDLAVHQLERALSDAYGPDPSLPEPDRERYGIN